MATTTTRYAVTEEQVQKCCRLVDESSITKDDLFETYYLVGSAHTADHYEVRWVASTPTHKGYLTCQCKAGQEGIPCWHKRAVREHAQRWDARAKELAKEEEAKASKSAQQAALASLTFAQEVAEQSLVEATARLTERRYNAPLHSNSQGFNLMR